jgi:hypothetical protein
MNLDDGDTVAAVARIVEQPAASPQENKSE